MLSIFFSFLASTCRQEKHWHLFLPSSRAGDRPRVSTLSFRETSWDYHVSYSAGSREMTVGNDCRKWQLLSYSANGTWIDLSPTSCSAVTHLYKQLAQRGFFPNSCHTATTHWINSIHHTAFTYFGNKHLGNLGSNQWGNLVWLRMSAESQGGTHWLSGDAHYGGALIPAWKYLPTPKWSVWEAP